MPDVEAKKDKEKDDVAAPKAAEATEQKKEKEEPEAEGAPAEAAAGGEAKQDEKKQVAPKVHITNPATGSAYPFKSRLPIEIECEGQGQFDGQLMLRDQKGKLVWDTNIACKLSPEGKGHYHVEIDLDKLEEGAYDRSGTYQLHAFGQDATGLQAPMSRITIDLLDEAKEKTPNMPKDVPGATPEEPGPGG